MGPGPRAPDLAEAARAWDSGDWEAAHEAFEARWRRGGPHAALYKALAQLAAAEVHRTRANPHGTRTLGARAAEALAQGGLDPLAAHARDLADRGLAAGPAPRFPVDWLGPGTRPPLTPPRK